MSQSDILLVDDTPANLTVLVSLLRRPDYTLRTAINGELALKAIQKKRPDLILLDIMMPGMDGYEVCRQLKADPLTQDIPVIFLTGLSELHNKIKGFELGAVDYITKPFQAQEVLLRVKAHVLNRRLQLAVQEERARFQTLVEATAEGVVLHDQGVILDVNPSIERIFGYSQAALIGKNIQQFLTERSRQRLDELNGTAFGQPEELAAIRADGTIIPIQVTGKSVMYQGREVRVTLIHDLSWRRTLEQENQTLRVTLQERDHFGKLTGKSLGMQKVYDRLLQAATSTAPVIIYGETGTGKELAARTLFDLSQTHARKFVSVNCSAIPENLFEAQMFGYLKGAFTGADRDTPGLFDQAQGGTLFLDEIGELPLLMQAKFLRVLQTGDYTPVGGTVSHTADLRLITATNRELRQLVSAGKMREDFFQRIHVIAVELPPLRQRKDDLPLLIAQFLRELTPAGIEPLTIPSTILEKFYAYDWPGNVRELVNEIRRYVTTREVELAGTLSASSRTLSDEETPFLQEGLPLSEAVDTFERFYIARALARQAGQRGKTADMLGIDRRTLYKKLQQHGLAGEE